MENGKAVNNLSSYYEKKSTPTIKAYRNSEYLNSSEARTIRIQCELEESKWRLKKEGVKGTVRNEPCMCVNRDIIQVVIIQCIWYSDNIVLLFFVLSSH